MTLSLSAGSVLRAVVSCGRVAALLLLSIGVNDAAEGLRAPDARVDPPGGLYPNSSTKAPALSVDGNRVYAVYVDQRNWLGFDPFFNVSVNEGGTWRDGDWRLNQQQIAGAPEGDTGLGRVMTAGDNFVYVLLTSNDGVVAVPSAIISSDRGETWPAAPTTISALDAQRYNFQLAVAPGGKMTVLFNDDRDGDGAELTSIWSRTTVNGGANWGADQKINIPNNEVAPGKFERAGEAVACTDNANRVFFAWRDRRDLNPLNTAVTAVPGQIVFRSATVGGAPTNPQFSFGPEVRIDSATPAAESLRPAIACRPSGADMWIAIVYQDQRAGNDDLFIRVSKNGGATFGAEARVDLGSPATANARNPKVLFSTATPTPRIYVAWEDDRAAGRDLFFAYSDNEGQTWTSAVQLNTNPTNGNFPVESWDIDAIGNNVVVAWSDNRNGSQTTVRRDIFARQSTNGGVNFSTDARLDLGTGPGVADSQSVDVGANASNHYTASYLDFRNATDRPDVFAGSVGNDWDRNDPDGDGLVNARDNCPNYPNSAQLDKDYDGRGELCDSFPADPFNDPDGDGIPSTTDRCPFRGDSLQEDTDLDGIGDACDFCKSTSEVVTRDLDLDGIGDVCDADSDNDGQPNTSDTDDDNDGVPDTSDKCVFVPNARQLDDDNDGAGNECDTDDLMVENLLVRHNTKVTTGPLIQWDKESGATFYNVYFGLAQRLKTNDRGYCYRPNVRTLGTVATDNPDPGQVFWYLATASNGTTEGSAGRASSGTPRQVPTPCDDNKASDWDGDTVKNLNDNCRFDLNLDQADRDGDRQGNVCDPFPADPTNDRVDSDGIGSDLDNCPFVANPGQQDGDADGVGNACDDCPAVADPLQTDGDKDGIGDACDGDIDNDGLGNAADTDDDADGVPDTSDNCKTIANRRQLDRDSDGIGDACDVNDGEVGGVIVVPRQAGGADVRWAKEQGATGYSVYSGLTSSLAVGQPYGSCFAPNIAVPFADAATATVPSTARFFLVTGIFGATQGTAGRDSAGNERTVPAGCP